MRRPSCPKSIVIESKHVTNDDVYWLIIQWRFLLIFNRARGTNKCPYKNRVAALCLNAFKNLVNSRDMQAYKEHLHSFRIIQPLLNDENHGEERNKQTMMKKRKRNAMHRTQKCTLRKRIRHYFYSFSFPILAFSPHVASCRCCVNSIAPNVPPLGFAGWMDKRYKGKNVWSKKKITKYMRIESFVSHTSKIGYYVMRVK